MDPTAIFSLSRLQAESDQDGLFILNLQVLLLIHHEEGSLLVRV